MSTKTQKKSDKPEVTPMMAQFMEIKEANPDYILFYRMGDFYEMFLDDAIIASKVLNITLTKRGRHNGDDIPMCGVPWHSHEVYLQRLINAGYKVAICEQLETPQEAKKRDGYKALVKRGVKRIATQGTIIEDNLLDANKHNYLCALAKTGKFLGLSWLDLSTGEFLSQPISLDNLTAALERLSAKEILIPDSLAQNEKYFDIWAEYKSQLTFQPDSRFDANNAEKRLLSMFDVATLDGFGDFSMAEIAAAGALIDYIDLTQKGQMPRLSPPKQLSMDNFMEIDAATRRNLELTHNAQGTRKNSLLDCIDMTVTGAGGRMIARHLSMPLTSIGEINERLDIVAFFIDNQDKRQNLRNELKKCADLERALSRLSMGRGSPIDLAAIRSSLSQSAEIQSIIHAKATHQHQGQDLFDVGIPSKLQKILLALKPWGQFHPLIDKLKRALIEELPSHTRNGGFIASGYSPKLDELRILNEDSRQLIAELQRKYIDLTSVPSLKIKNNNILGYYIDVSPQHGAKLLAKDEVFVHRQTLANSIRFTTSELADLEHKTTDAADKALILEQELFTALTQDVLSNADAIIDLAQALSSIDVATSLAELATTKNYTRPTLDNSLTFEIKKGRHPVVEQVVSSNEAEDFIANNCELNQEDKLWLLTGPNMAGKSTFLRQNALIALMAQMGAYVPAEKAHIGIIDRIFSRVGASDDLARGRSTFMVEMVETATILNQATKHSFVILDEIGRGTSTFDGLSIAWAVMEHLHNTKECRTLFATHYHELAELTNKLDQMSCHTMKVKEWKDKIVFLHEVISGTADRSYGIHVAKLAGLPKDVIIRASQVLNTLEQGKNNSILDTIPNVQSVPVETLLDDNSKNILNMVEKIEPDTLTPREALDFIYKLTELTK